MQQAGAAGASQFEQAFAASKLGRVTATARQVGVTLTKFLTLPLAIAAAGAAKVALNFQTALAKIQGLVRIPADEVKRLGEEVLALAPAVARGPQELADALYFITSSGFSASESMGVLKASAKAAAAGLGDTKTVADAVTSAMNAYGHRALSAADATDILTAAVREGKGEPVEYSQAIGAAIPVAAQLGVQFREVAAAIASATLAGIDTSRAAQALRFLLANFLKPTAIAVKSLREFGYTADSVRKSLGERGLLATLTELHDKLPADVFARVVGGVRGLNIALALVGENSAHVVDVFDKIANSTGDTNRAFVVASHTVQFQFNKALAELEVAGINAGQVVLPILSKILGSIANLAEGFTNLSQGQQKFLVQIGLFLVVLGPAVRLITGVARSVGLLIAGFKALAAWIEGTTVAEQAEAAAAEVDAAAKAKLLAATGGLVAVEEQQAAATTAAAATLGELAIAEDTAAVQQALFSTAMLEGTAQMELFNAELFATEASMTSLVIPETAAAAGLGTLLSAAEGITPALLEAGGAATFAAKGFGTLAAAAEASAAGPVAELTAALGGVIGPAAGVTAGIFALAAAGAGLTWLQDASIDLHRIGEEALLTKKNVDALIETLNPSDIGLGEVLKQIPRNVLGFLPFVDSLDEIGKKIEKAIIPVFKDLVASGLPAASAIDTLNQAFQDNLGILREKGADAFLTAVKEQLGLIIKVNAEGARVIRQTSAALVVEGEKFLSTTPAILNYFDIMGEAERVTKEMGHDALPITGRAAEQFGSAIQLLSNLGVHLTDGQKKWLVYDLAAGKTSDAFALINKLIQESGKSLDAFGKSLDGGIVKIGRASEIIDRKLNPAFKRYQTATARAAQAFGVSATDFRNSIDDAFRTGQIDSFRQNFDTNIDDVIAKAKSAADGIGAAFAELQNQDKITGAAIDKALRDQISVVTRYSKDLLAVGKVKGATAFLDYVKSLPLAEGAAVLRGFETTSKAEQGKILDHFDELKSRSEKLGNQLTADLQRVKDQIDGLLSDLPIEKYITIHVQVLPGDIGPRITATPGIPSNFGGNTQTGQHRTALGGIIAGQHGFIARHPTYLVGEGNYPTFAGMGAEGVIPFGERGINLMSEFVSRALQRLETRSSGQAPLIGTLHLGGGKADLPELLHRLRWLRAKRGW